MLRPSAYTDHLTPCGAPHADPGGRGLLRNDETGRNAARRGPSDGSGSAASCGTGGPATCRSATRTKGRRNRRTVTYTTTDDQFRLTRTDDDGRTRSGYDRGMSTRERLLSAAEELIAEEGIGVSLRSIAAKGEANSAAIHYHFGAKEQLVRATLDRRMAEMARRRPKILAAADDIDPPPLRIVIEAYVRPLAEWTQEEGNHYVRFLAAVHRGGQPWQDLMNSTLAPYASGVRTMVDRALPDLDAELREFRHTASMLLMLQVLGGHTAVPAAWTHAEVCSALIDTMVGLLTAPVTTKTGSSRRFGPVAELLRDHNGSSGSVLLQDIGDLSLKT